MLVDAEAPKAHSAIHLLFIGEKVRKEYTEAVPVFSPAVQYENGISIISVADLVKMKLTSFRDKDRVHVRDLDGVGLITAEVEAGLSPILLECLKQGARRTGDEGLLIKRVGLPSNPQNGR
jgi:hypothetical protein